MSGESLPLEVTAMQVTIARFIASRWAAGRRPSTIVYYQNSLGQFARWAKAHGVEWPPALEDLRRFLGHKRDGGCVEVTLRSYWTALAAWLNWCEVEDLLEEADNPISRLEKPHLKKRIPRAVAKPVLKQLFDAMATAGRRGDNLATRDHALFRLIYDTGLRASEASYARLDDLDIMNSSLVIRESKGSQRIVYFGRWTGHCLSTWLAVRPFGGSTIFVGRCEAPRRLGRRGIYTRLLHWCDVAGVARVRVHDLRHSHATHALRDGVPLSDLQRQLGHSSLSVTEIYLSTSDPQRAESYRQHSPGDALFKLDTLEED